MLGETARNQFDDYIKSASEKEVVYENNRLYALYEGLEVICPIGMHELNSDCDNQELQLYLYFE